MDPFDGGGGQKNFLNFRTSPFLLTSALIGPFTFLKLHSQSIDRKIDTQIDMQYTGTYVYVHIYQFKLPHQSVNMLKCLSIYLFYMCACIFIYLSNFIYIYSVCVLINILFYVCSIYPFGSCSYRIVLFGSYLSVSTFDLIYLFYVFQFIYISYLSIYFSIYLIIYLSICLYLSIYIFKPIEYLYRECQGQIER